MFDYLACITREGTPNKKEKTSILTEIKEGKYKRERSKQVAG